MIDYKKYGTEQYNIDFIEGLKETLGIDSQMEVFLVYKNFHMELRPSGNEVYLCSGGVILQGFSSADDFFENCMLDEKRVIELIDEIEIDHNS